MQKIVKRLDEDARVAFALLRELCIYSLDYYDDSCSAGLEAAPYLVETGLDASTDLATPQTVESTSLTFGDTYIGKYLVLKGASNFGVYKITGENSATNTIIVTGGKYGASFTTEAGISWRIVDPAKVPAGALTFSIECVGVDPTWIALFSLGPGITDTFSYQVYPTGTSVVTATASIICDSTPMWYILADSYFIRLWTEDTAGTAVYNIGYIGSGTDRRPEMRDLVPSEYADNGGGLVRVTVTSTVGTGAQVVIADTTGTVYDGTWDVTYVDATHIDLDGSTFTVNPAAKGTCTPISCFAVCFGGAPLTALADIKSIGTDEVTQTVYEAIMYCIASTNVFTSLPESPLDQRNDAALISIGTADATLPEDDRGTLKGMYWVSDLLGYKDFVDNGRKLLSISDSTVPVGVAMEWDGSLSR